MTKTKIAWMLYCTAIGWLCTHAIIRALLIGEFLLALFSITLWLCALIYTYFGIEEIA